MLRDRPTPGNSVKKPDTAIPARGGARRRLSRHVLTPLLLGGLALTAATSTGATLAARHAALRDLDGRAAQLHVLAARSLRGGNGVGAAAIAAARAQGGTVRATPAA